MRVIRITWGRHSRNFRPVLRRKSVHTEIGNRPFGPRWAIRSELPTVGPPAGLERSNHTCGFVADSRLRLHLVTTLMEPLMSELQRRRRTEKLSELRQDRIRIDGLSDEHDLQLRSVLLKNRHMGGPVCAKWLTPPGSE
jgi:hypothetical protein